MHMDSLYVTWSNVCKLGKVEEASREIHNVSVMSY